MITLALCNQKGGVGKSTSTFHLARAAARVGTRTLVIDLDPQGNISAALTREFLPETTPGIADALSARSNETLPSVIVPSIWDKVDLAPTVGEALAVVRDELVIAGAGREGRLRQALVDVDDVYDLVLVDCPPSLDQLTINALTAADRLLVVSQSKQWSATGLAHLLDTVDAVRRYYNPPLTIAGILINQHDATTRAGTHWVGELRTAAEKRDLRLLSTIIPKRVAIADAVEASRGLDQFPGVSAELVDAYDTILEEVIA